MVQNLSYHERKGIAVFQWIQVAYFLLFDKGNGQSTLPYLRLRRYYQYTCQVSQS